MGDAATRGAFDNAEITTRQASQSPFDRENTKFVYALYRWCTNDKRIGNQLKHRRAMTKSARVMDRISSSAWKREKALPEFLKLLKSRDERAWLRLLLWLGKSHHMFGAFKVVSPFVDKVIAKIHFNDGCTEHCVGSLDALSLPRLTQFWPPRRVVDVSPGRAIIIFPKDSTFSVHKLWSLV